MRKTNASPSPQNIPFHLAKLPAGLYGLTVKDHGFFKTEKAIFSPLGA